VLIRMVRKLRRSNLSEDAYAVVRDILLNGDRYNPGDKVSVEELSRQLGVSRTPLWAAINRLEAELVVEVVPRQGVYLIDYDPRRALEMYIAREALEGMAARLAADNATERQIALMQRSVEEQRKCLSKGNLDGYYTRTLEFHQEVVRAANNQTLERLLTSVFAQMQAMRIQRKSMPTHLPKSCADHEKILAAIRKRDPDRAEREARTHMQDLSSTIRRTIAKEQPRIAEKEPQVRPRSLLPAR
jgi:DNA-binding GntR family transcriptional regulator